METDRVVQLPTQVWEHIVQLGVERHIQELENKLEKAQQQIAEFERRFGMPFDRLQTVGLPEDAGLAAHEDYVEWSSWEGVRTELAEQLENLRALLEPTRA